MSSEAQYEMLTLLGYESAGVALVRDEHEATSEAARLAWWIGQYVPRTAETASRFDEKVTVLAAIGFYGELLLVKWRRELAQLAEAGEKDVRDPSSFTIEEAREQAAEEVLDASLDAMLAVDPRASLVGPARRFNDEIVVALGAYPTVAANLLYRDRTRLHRSEFK